MSPFRNRIDAGRKLAAELRAHKSLGSLSLGSAVLLGLPRGGLPVAYEAARLLKLPLDIAVVRKVGAPENPEYGIGAIAEDGVTWLNDEAVSSVGLGREEALELAALERPELLRRVKAFREDRPPLDLRGKTAILVDDGLATGATAVAAAIMARKRGAKNVILAVPVCAAQSLRELARNFDAIVCLEAPERFFAVGLWYEDFSQLTDDDVLAILARSRSTLIPIGGGDSLEAELALPPERPTIGAVIFAHGSGSSRLSPRNLEVARELRKRGMATLLFDLLTADEARDRSNVFDIPLLTSRLELAARWLRARPGFESTPLAFFGASTGAAAALSAAARLRGEITAVVSRGGRPDLMSEDPGRVRCPVLLLVGGDDTDVLELNARTALELPRCELAVIPGATHLFEEPGALEEVARRARNWLSAQFQAALDSQAA